MIDPSIIEYGCYHFETEECKQCDYLGQSEKYNFVLVCTADKCPYEKKESEKEK